jgi:glycosyltransferase involved in cell wall biosynthesis
MGMVDLIAISVIIPTYNRAEVLRTTLQALDKQTLPANEIELIVVDDGSEDQTPQVVLETQHPYYLRYHRQQNSGAAAARNLGAQYAQGEVLLFLDDDMSADPNLLSNHLASHQHGGGILVIGLRHLTPDLLVRNPAARLIYGRGGIDPRKSQAPITYMDAFTCNLSIRNQDWICVKGFDEEFPASGFEDVEFAYRAVQAGMRIVMNPDAYAYHNHPMTLKQEYNHARNYARSVPLLIRKHPELHGTIAHMRSKEPVSWREDPPKMILRKINRRILSIRPVMWLMESILQMLINIPGAPEKFQRFLYWRIIAGYELTGFQQGTRQYGWVKVG